MLLLPATTLARQRASIVGVVQDASGAVMPGVTVEASSPALIEQVRSAVTDGAGRYAIIDLRPGYYDYVQTMDARISKSVRFGRRRLQVFMELFNVPNNATVLTVNETVGPLYFNPQAITAGRRAQFGAQIDW